MHDPLIYVKRTRLDCYLLIATRTMMTCDVITLPPPPGPGPGPRKSTSRMACQTVVGYACDFVDTIPKELQTECSICLHVLRDPHMVDCCGYRFCKSCIEQELYRASSGRVQELPSLQSPTAKGSGG